MAKQGKQASQSRPGKHNQKPYNRTTTPSTASSITPPSQPAGTPAKRPRTGSSASSTPSTPSSRPAGTSVTNSGAGASTSSTSSRPPSQPAKPPVTKSRTGVSAFAPPSSASSSSSTSLSQSAGTPAKKSRAGPSASSTSSRPPSQPAGTPVTNSGAGTSTSSTSSRPPSQTAGTPVTNSQTGPSAFAPPVAVSAPLVTVSKIPLKHSVYIPPSKKHDFIEPNPPFKQQQKQQKQKQQQQRFSVGPFHSLVQSHPNYLSPKRHPTSFEPDSGHPEVSAPRTETNAVDEPMKTFLRLCPADGSTTKPEASHVTVLDDTVTVLDGTKGLMGPSQNSESQKSFKHKFTKVFDETKTHSRVFEETCLPLLTPMLRQNNYKAAVFSYGGSNSGKTQLIVGSSGQSGILPRALEVLLSSIAKCSQEEDMLTLYRPVGLHGVEQVNLDEYKHNDHIESIRKLDQNLATLSQKLNKDPIDFSVDNLSAERQGSLNRRVVSLPEGMNYSIWVSCAEIYTERIYDLLAASSEPAPPFVNPTDSMRPELHLEADTVTATGEKYNIHGLREVEVRTMEEAMLVLRAGFRQQQVSSAYFDKSSPKSHCVVTIKVLKAPQFGLSAREVAAKGKLSVSRLSFVDLAGPEHIRNANNTSQGLGDGGNVDTSLMVLGHCLEVLRFNQTVKSEISLEVPFRRSKLTQLFEGALEPDSADSHVCLIINVNPFQSAFDDMTQSLQFSSVATEITPEDSKMSFSNIKRQLGSSTLGPQPQTTSQTAGNSNAQQHPEDAVALIQNQRDSLYMELENVRRRLYFIESESREAVVSDMMEHSLTGFASSSSDEDKKMVADLTEKLEDLEEQRSMELEEQQTIFEARERSRDQDVDKLNDQLAESESTREQLEATVQHQEEQIKQLKQDLADRDAKQLAQEESLRSTALSLDQEVKRLEQLVEENEFARLEQEKSAEAEHHKLEELVEKLTTDLSNSLNDRDNLRDKLREQSAKDQELAQLRVQLTDQLREQSARDQELARLKDQIIDQLREQSAKDQELARLKDQLIDQLREQSAKDQKLAQLEDVVETSSNPRENLSREQSAKDQELAQQKEKLAQLKEELAASDKRRCLKEVGLESNNGQTAVALVRGLEVSEDRLRTLETELAETKEDLNALRAWFSQAPVSKRAHGVAPDATPEPSTTGAHVHEVSDDPLVGMDQEVSDNPSVDIEQMISDGPSVGMEQVVSVDPSVRLEQLISESLAVKRLEAILEAREQSVKQVDVEENGVEHASETIVKQNDPMAVQDEDPTAVQEEDRTISKDKAEATSTEQVSSPHAAHGYDSMMPPAEAEAEPRSAVSTTEQISLPHAEHGYDSMMPAVAEAEPSSVVCTAAAQPDFGGVAVIDPVSDGFRPVKHKLRQPVTAKPRFHVLHALLTSQKPNQHSIAIVDKTGGIVSVAQDDYSYSALAPQHSTRQHPTNSEAGQKVYQEVDQEDIAEELPVHQTPEAPATSSHVPMHSGDTTAEYQADAGTTELVDVTAAQGPLTLHTTAQVSPSDDVDTIQPVITLGDHGCNMQAEPTQGFEAEDDIPAEPLRDVGAEGQVWLGELDEESQDGLVKMSPGHHQSSSFMIDDHVGTRAAETSPVQPMYPKLIPLSLSPPPVSSLSLFARSEAVIANDRSPSLRPTPWSEEPGTPLRFPGRRDADEKLDSSSLLPPPDDIFMDRSDAEKAGSHSHAGVDTDDEFGGVKYEDEYEEGELHGVTSDEYSSAQESWGPWEEEANGASKEMIPEDKENDDPNENRRSVESLSAKAKAKAKAIEPEEIKKEEDESMTRDSHNVALKPKSKKRKLRQAATVFGEEMNEEVDMFEQPAKMDTPRLFPKVKSSQKQKHKNNKMH
ncbi:hypothetical protein BGX29_007930 [Mortierella sp. GBA35]|nr:hypothetical protein BGX29_007930 [Mortierella sp. GBA35]